MRRFIKKKTDKALDTWFDSLYTNDCRFNDQPFVREIVGLWRSLVARLHGAQEVVGSNPASPTK